jgi:short subunit dehydrogenase-like uncharacterized protein
MAERTRVVVTTVGPYAKYGLPLVEACAAAGTDYADLTGEPHFMRKTIDLFHKQAVDTGARIVHACGFDSIPSDLTVFALYRKAAEDGTETIGRTAGERDAHTGARAGQIFGRQLPDEAGCPVQDEIEFTLRCGHG